MLDGLTETRAPFHRRLAQGPAEAEARWVMLPDGVRLRAVHWARDAPMGTVLVFTGRTEYAEKYGRVAGDLRSRGYATLTVDWRGQGLSDRLRGDRSLGHVGKWSDYQRDVAAMVAHGRELGLPEPWFMLAHSMGGAIGLRALIEGLPVRAAVFSAPMWGFAMTAALKPVAWSVSSMSRAFALSHLLMPGAEPFNYVLCCDFADNLLTSDRETWEWLRSHMTAEPDLGVGAPSLHWLNEALREMRRLMWAPAPKVPALGLVGSEEAVVDPARIGRRLDDWPGARLVTLQGARHEVLMERPVIRGRALAEVVALFEGARKG
ncbi:Lysophospholipase L2 [Rubellimicrobium mesophilum DSM 19309]|uniref:Lysophospholipase L2 n=1 Tax=Rubellimicrobium mesophilum DSM 19309 TaxID=442562 RepID=A0A017HCN5_9RHOB|nr:alpha/beta hydrolase [Rubellimicrobium mesophilum]EYD72136.1 Lysophospholipase L2 [Rubellimicrobium mesophilum DSM 19309]